jgi:hypothetical protein
MADRKTSSRNSSGPEFQEPTLWRQYVTSVVTLTQQMRQAGDLEFAKHLQSFRDGTVTKADIDFFNQQFVGSLNGASALESIKRALPQTAPSRGAHYTSFVPIVVTDNKERVQMSNEVVRHLHKLNVAQAEDKRSAFFCIDASYSRSSGRDIANTRSAQAPSFVGQIKPEEEPNLFTILRHTTVKDADQRLRLFIGMEVMVTENINLASGIANGSRGYVACLQLTEDHKKLPTIIDTDLQGVPVYSISSVARLIVRLLRPDGTPSSVQLEDDLGVGEFSVWPGSFSLSKALASKLRIGYGAVAGIKMHALPLVPAVALTAYKTQGRTMPQLILASTLDNRNRPPAQRFLYVVLSRLQSLKGLVLLQRLPFDPNHSSYSLGDDLKNEIVRLARVEATTIQRIGAFAAKVFGLHSPAPVPTPVVPASSILPTPRLPIPVLPAAPKPAAAASNPYVAQLLRSMQARNTSPANAAASPAQQPPPNAAAAMHLPNQPAIQQQPQPLVNLEDNGIAPMDIDQP